MTGTRADARKRHEAEDAAIQRCIERRREIVRDALGAVYSGAGMEEADAFLDALGDLDGRVVL